MRRLFCVFPTLLMVIVLSGCVTQPQYHKFNNHAKIDKSFDIVWQNIIGYFATNNIAIKNIAKDSGVIYADMAFTDFDSIVDCGSAIPTHPAIMEMNVFVKRTSPVEVQVNTTTKFHFTSLPTGISGTVDCTSRGFIEQAILEAARK